MAAAPAVLPGSAGAEVAGPVVAVVLGTAQDGGVPQANCRCPRCQAARSGAAPRRPVAALGLLDPAAGATFLVDATPDLPAQLEALAADPLLPLAPGRSPLAGLLLTHAHVGHYAGLLHFGREVMGSRDLPVHATPRMSRFLADNGPWSQLVGLSQICLEPLPPGQTRRLTARLSATALAVPHRDEFSDTVAWLIEGPRRRLLWLPDIDKWDRWDLSLETLLGEVDYAFLDATFLDQGELPGRSLRDIPHPLVGETLARLRAMSPPPRARVFLIHLNHSNPLLGPDPAVRREIEAQGVTVAEEGMRFEL